MKPEIRKRRRDLPEVRREQILNEAIRIIGERGYHGFSIQELAARCGLTNPGMLHHFNSKDQLLVAVIQHIERGEIPAMAALAAQARGGSSKAATLELLDRMASRASTQPELVRLHAVLQAESLNPAHPAYESYKAREAAVLNLFIELVEPYVTDASSTARLMLAVLNGLTLQWLRSEQKFDVSTEWLRAITTLVPPLATGREAKRLSEGASDLGAARKAPRSVSRDRQNRQ